MNGKVEVVDRRRGGKTGMHSTSLTRTAEVRTKWEGLLKASAYC